MKIFLTILSILVLLYGLLVAIAYLVQERLIFHPVVLPDNYPFEFQLPFSEMYYPTSDGARLHALHFKTTNPKGIILYFHGNAGALNDWGHIAQYFVHQGYDVLIPDYRGFGKSRGERSEKALHEDANLIYQSLLKTYSEKDIILYGRSIGSGIATELATNTTPKQLILESPFLSLDAIAKQIFPILPVTLTLKYHFYNDRKINHIHIPIHIFHGTADNLIPFWHSLQLLEKIKDQNGTLTTIEGGGHNDLALFETYQAAMHQLLQ